MTTPPGERLPISVALITRNAGTQLAACLESVAFADDVVVVDSGSTDDTRAIAARHGARVIDKAWMGFGRQKQFAVESARHDWVLCLDADERVTPQLAESIGKVIAAPREYVYRMPRCNRFMGRWLRHGEGYPDWNTRFFHRAHARWSNDEVHEHVISTEAVGQLKGDLLHESAETLASYLDKQNRYTSLQADALVRDGVRVSAMQLIGSPLVRFMKFYVLRLGFLDGVAGFVHIVIGCANSFIKYAKAIAAVRAGPPRAGR
jgi:glycosyltransferase involved in cell wall biosynthesis